MPLGRELPVSVDGHGDDTGEGVADPPDLVLVPAHGRQHLGVDGLPALEPGHHVGQSLLCDGDRTGVQAVQPAQHRPRGEDDDRGDQQEGAAAAPDQPVHLGLQVGGLRIGVREHAPRPVRVERGQLRRERVVGGTPAADIGRQLHSGRGVLVVADDRILDADLGAPGVRGGELVVRSLFRGRQVRHDPGVVEVPVGAESIEQLGETGGRQLLGRPGQSEEGVFARDHLSRGVQRDGGPALLGEFRILRVAEFILVCTDDVADHTGVVVDHLVGAAAVGVRALTERGQLVKPGAHLVEVPAALP